MTAFDKKAKPDSVIKYEGDNETLVFKHPMEDFDTGSQLIVHEGQEAVFFRDGQALDVFGPGRYTLKIQQVPLLEKVYDLPVGVEATFHSEIYFVNRTTQMGIKWGTDSKVRLFDPASGLHVELGASGEFSIRVTDSRRLLLKMVGATQGFSQKELLGSDGGRGAFRALVMTQVKSCLARAIKASEISVLEIDAHLVKLSEMLRVHINALLEDYGLTMPEFFVSRVVTPDDDPNYRRMKEQYAEQYLLVRQEQIRKSEAEAAQARKLVEAETEAKIKVVAARGAAEATRLQAGAEAEAAAMGMKVDAYQQATARQAGRQSDERVEEGWDCACGQKGMTSNFCPNCGAKRPSPTWDCPDCGAKDLASRFCPNCGRRRDE